MLHTAPAFLAKTAYSALLTSASQELGPTKSRQSIADLVGQNRLAEADLLLHEALQRFLQSEDILVIRALVTQARQDWPAASAALEKLITFQGHAAKAVSWGQWVRVLHCQGDGNIRYGLGPGRPPARPPVVGRVQCAAAGRRQAGAQGALRQLKGEMTCAAVQP